MQQQKSNESTVPYVATDFNANNQPVALSGTQHTSNLIRLLFPQDDYFEQNYYALYLNERNEALQWKFIGSGPTGTRPTDVKQIVSDLYFAEATQVLLVHSQPTGTPKADAKTQHFTEQIRLLLALCEATLADHIIINENSYYSMLDAGDISPLETSNN